MNIISARNPQWADAANSSISLLVTFGTLGEVPFSASLADIEPHGAWVYNQAVAGAFGPIAAFPAPTLSQVQAEKISSLQSSYRSAIQLPVSYMGTTFQADSGSQDTLNKSLVALGGSVPAGFYWVDSLNNQIPMTFAQLQWLAAAMMAQGWTAFQHLQAQKALVNAATTVAAVQAIIW